MKGIHNRKWDLTIRYGMHLLDTGKAKTAVEARQAADKALKGKTIKECLDALKKLKLDA